MSKLGKLKKADNQTLNNDKIFKKVTRRESRRNGVLDHVLNKKIISHAKFKLAQKNRKAPIITPSELVHFRNNFSGFWVLKTIEDWSWNTLIQFFLDDNNVPMARFFDGTQNNIREILANDNSLVQNPVIRFYPEFETEIVPVTITGSRSLIIHNTPPPHDENFLSRDQLKSTIKIQDFDTNLAVAQFWTDWDGTADDVKYGTVENLSLYRRLTKQPCIQQEGKQDFCDKVDWNNPVDIFNYVNDYYYLLGQPQKNIKFCQNNYIGQKEAQKLFCKFVCKGLTRKAIVSNKQRGETKDKKPIYIGVWRTYPDLPDGYRFTTIHTQQEHKFNQASTVEIKGFKGPYAVLNGKHKIAARAPSTVSTSTPFPWQCPESREPYIYINYDSSNIAVPYNPNIHGVATIVAQHGPITPKIGYRDFMASLIDYNISVWGPGTHTRLRTWINPEDYLVPETWEELAKIVANTSNDPDSVFGNTTTVNFRTYIANGNTNIYHNPYQTGAGPAFGEANLNDPFGLGLIDLFMDEKFDYDIDINNYLEPGTVHNVYWTVTGPELKNEPVTSQLVNNGYPSNGSQIHFTTHPHQNADTVRTNLPKPLVDKFGVHPYRLFGAATDPSTPPDDDDYLWEFQTFHNYVGGIVRKDLTGGKTIAYFRIGDEDAYDSPFFLTSLRSVAFGRKDMPKDGMNSNAIAALAALITHLNKFNPEKYILDNRSNEGGFASYPAAFATLFGANRPGIKNYIVESGGDHAKVWPLSKTQLKTANNSLTSNIASDALINTDLVSKIFPNAIVRAKKPGQIIELIILTDTYASSGGDTIPHFFIGSNPNALVHDLGHGVISRIVGDIDGRLWSGSKYFDGIAMNQQDPRLKYDNGKPASSVFISAEGGLVLDDRHGTMVNEQPWTRPAILLPKWYDNTTWVDIGYTNPTVEYPILHRTNPEPDDQISWRDLWLEFAIITPVNPSITKQVNFCLTKC